MNLKYTNVNCLTKKMTGNWNHLTILKSKVIWQYIHTKTELQSFKYNVHYGHHYPSQFMQYSRACISYHVCLVLKFVNITKVPLSVKLLSYLHDLVDHYEKGDPSSTNTFGMVLITLNFSMKWFIELFFIAMKFTNILDWSLSWNVLPFLLWTFKTGI